MALSPADKAFAEAAYARSKPGILFRGGMAGGFIGAVVGISPTISRHLLDSQTSHRDVILLWSILGLFLGLVILFSIFHSRQRKQDLEIVHFFEKHFPADCSWKQEEQILAQAEDLRLKAKVDRLIHSQA